MYFDNTMVGLFAFTVLVKRLLNPMPAEAQDVCLYHGGVHATSLANFIVVQRGGEIKIDSRLGSSRREVQVRKVTKIAEKCE